MERFIVTDPLWAVLFIGALFIGGAWRFGKDLEEATDEMVEGRKKAEQEVEKDED